MKTVLRETPPVERPARRGTDRPSDEIDLLAYAAGCWRYRYALLAATLIVGLVTYAINRRMAPTFEAHFRLMGTESAAASDGERLNIVAFRALVESPTEAAALVSEFGLDREPHNLTPQRFLDDHLDVEVIRDSTIIDVAVRLRNDPELLVKVARRYAERVVETAQRLNTEGIDYTAEKIKHQRDAALERLKLAERAYEEYQRRAQVEVLRKDVDTLLERRPEALDLNVRIQGGRARLQQAEAELAKQERVRTVPRGVDSVSPPTAPAGEGLPAQPELRLRSELLDQFVNPVHEALQRDVSNYRAQLAGLEQERKELVARLNLDAPSADKLNRLYQAEGMIESLSRDIDIARDAYLNAANKYEDARLQSTLRSPRLQILDAALPPDRPVAPRAARNTAAAMLFALTFGAILAIVFEARRRSES